MKERGNFIETFKIKTLFPSSLLRKKATRKKMKNRKRGKGSKEGFADINFVDLN